MSRAIRLDMEMGGSPEELAAQATFNSIDDIWEVQLMGEWHATWSNEEGAREHARRINALEWRGDGAP